MCSWQFRTAGLYEVWRAELPFNPRAVLAEATKYLEWISHLDPETVDDEIVQQATIDLVGQIIERAYNLAVSQIC